MNKIREILAEGLYSLSLVIDSLADLVDPTDLADEWTEEDEAKYKEIANYITEKRREKK